MTDNILQYKLETFGLYYSTKPKIKSYKKKTREPIEDEFSVTKYCAWYQQPSPYDIFENSQRPEQLGDNWEGYNSSVSLNVVANNPQAFKNKAFELKKILLFELKRETICHPNKIAAKILKKDLIFVLANNPYNTEQTKTFWVEAGWVEPYYSETDYKADILQKFKAKWCKQ